MKSMNKKLFAVLLLPLSSALSAESSNFTTGQAKLPNGRMFNYLFDPASQTFGVDLNGMANIQYQTYPALSTEEKDCGFWDDTIIGLPDLRDAATTLSSAPKPKSDFSFKISFMDRYLSSSVSEAVSSNLKEKGYAVSKIKNGTELNRLNASVILKWDDSSLTKRGKNNLIADAESRFSLIREPGGEGSAYFKVDWKGVNQYVACDLLRKAVHFVVVYQGENLLRYRSGTQLDARALKQVWSEVGTPTPHQGDILSNGSLSGSSLSYRDAQWALAGAQLAIASHHAQINADEDFSAKTFFTFLDAFFDSTSVSPRKDFENEVLPRVANALSTEQKKIISIFKGDKIL